MTAKPVPEHISDERLLEALKPFAALGQYLIDQGFITKPDDAGLWGFDDHTLTYGDFRAAAAALTELQHRREGTCKSCNGTGGEYNLCSDCGGSGIEFVYGGHGNVLEVPCSTCAASPSSPASGVRVKALEWVQNWPSDTLTGFAKVDHINRTYTVDHDGPRFYASTNVSPSDYSGDAIGNYGTFDEAKAACQADYETRILSALGEHP